MCLQVCVDIKSFALAYITRYWTVYRIFTFIGFPYTACIIVCLFSYAGQAGRLLASSAAFKRTLKLSRVNRIATTDTLQVQCFAGNRTPVNDDITVFLRNSGVDSVETVYERRR